MNSDEIAAENWSRALGLLVVATDALRKYPQERISPLMWHLEEFLVPRVGKLSKPDEAWNLPEDDRLERATALLAEVAEVLRKYPEVDSPCPRAWVIDDWHKERVEPALKLVEEFLSPTEQALHNGIREQ